jgi:hypothetical protein
MRRAVIWACLIALSFAAPSQPQTSTELQAKEAEIRRSAPYESLSAAGSKLTREEYNRRVRQLALQQLAESYASGAEGQTSKSTDLAEKEAEIRRSASYGDLLRAGSKLSREEYDQRVRALAREQLAARTSTTDTLSAEQPGVPTDLAAAEAEIRRTATYSELQRAGSRLTRQDYDQRVRRLALEKLESARRAPENLTTSVEPGPSPTGLAAQEAHIRLSAPYSALLRAGSQITREEYDRRVRALARAQLAQDLTKPTVFYSSPSESSSISSLDGGDYVRRSQPSYASRPPTSVASISRPYRAASSTPYQVRSGTSGTATRIGDFTFYNDNKGTSGTATRIGDFTFYDDNKGTRGTATQIGDFTYYNDNKGRRCVLTKIGTTSFSNCY